MEMVTLLAQSSVLLCEDLCPLCKTIANARALNLYAREVQEPFCLSFSKWKLGVLKWLQSKITFDPREVLSKLEDHRESDGVFSLHSN